MKILSRAITATTLSAALFSAPILPCASAQTPPAPTNPVPVIAPIPAPIPAPIAVEKPAAPAKPKPAAKPVVKQAEAKPLPKLDPVLSPEPGAARQNNINVRGQATLSSEAITQLKKGEPVLLLEVIEIKKPKQDQPPQWYRIALPPQVSVWVHSSFVDTNTSTIKARRLNLRGGPGENFSIVGRLTKGAAVKPLDAKGEWLKIETPTNAFGFVAAHLIERQPASIAVAPPVPKSTEFAVVTPPVAPAPTVTDVTPVAPPAVSGAPVTPLTPVTPADTAVIPPPAFTNAVVEAVTNAPIETVRKIVSREGLLKGSFSIQAPAYFELRSLETGSAIAYVHSASTNLVLKEYKGLHVIVTGEEVLDERWQNTPVITVESLQTLP